MIVIGLVTVLGVLDNTSFGHRVNYTYSKMYCDAADAGVALQGETVIQL